MNTKIAAIALSIVTLTGAMTADKLDLLARGRSSASTLRGVERIAALFARGARKAMPFLTRYRARVGAGTIELTSRAALLDRSRDREGAVAFWFAAESTEQRSIRAATVTGMRLAAGAASCPARRSIACARSIAWRRPPW